jgi:hypothetical protein
MTSDQIETLIADAVCINSCIPPGMQLAVLIALLDQIVTSGGPGGINNFAGSGPPTTQVPTNGAGTYWDYTNSIQYQWNPISATWTQ